MARVETNVTCCGEVTSCLSIPPEHAVSLGDDEVKCRVCTNSKALLC